AGLAGEDAEARLELELEPLDQHDVVDRELLQHARKIDRAAAPGLVTPTGFLWSGRRFRIAGRFRTRGPGPGSRRGNLTSRRRRARPHSGVLLLLDQQPQRL